MPSARLIERWAIQFNNKYTIAMRHQLLLPVLLSLASFPSLADQNYPFAVESERAGNYHRIVARNNGPAPISVKVSIVDSQYISTDRPFPTFAVVPPNGGILYLGQIGPAMAGVGYTFRTQASSMLGDYNASHSQDAIYRLPFKDGLSFRIGQAPGGPITTHTTPESQFAVDIPMPEGTPVLAARDGIVIKTETNHTDGGKQTDMLSKANVVNIIHQDGTIGTYAHLAHGGVYVYPGQRVTAGTEIGLAGSTGYSSGPHLHFAVQKVTKTQDGFSMISLPFHFYVGNPRITFAPQFGMSAKADYASPGNVTLLAALPGTPAHAPTPNVTASQQAVGNEMQRGSIWPVLLQLPIWQSLVGIIAIFVLLLRLNALRSRRKLAEQAAWATVRNRMPRRW